MNPSQLSLGVAFVAGLTSFLSPCMLPLVPVYLAQLVGQSIYQSTSTSTGELTYTGHHAGAESVA